MDFILINLYSDNYYNKYYNIKIKEYSKCLEFIPNTYFYFGIIQCLVNIKQLREIFLNKQFLIDKKIIENSSITKKYIKYFSINGIWQIIVKFMIY